MKSVAGSFALIVMIIAPAWAGYDEGMAAYQRGEYEAALHEFEPDAQAGDTASQRMLGLLYSFGLGTAQDTVTAAHWYRSAAQRGDPVSQYRLALLYLAGGGIPQDNEQAIRWLHRAAEHNFTDAHVLLGWLYDDVHMYEETATVEKHPGTAASWYLKAAQSGNPYAEFKLGMMYFEGRGVQQSDKEALALLHRAIEQGELDSVSLLYAYDALQTVYEAGPGTERDEVEAEKWRERSMNALIGVPCPEVYPVVPRTMPSWRLVANSEVIAWGQLDIPEDEWEEALQGGGSYVPIAVVVEGVGKGEIGTERIAFEYYVNRKASHPPPSEIKALDGEAFIVFLITSQYPDGPRKFYLSGEMRDALQKFDRRLFEQYLDEIQRQQEILLSRQETIAPNDHVLWSKVIGIVEDMTDPAKQPRAFEKLADLGLHVFPLMIPLLDDRRRLPIGDIYLQNCSPDAFENFRHLGAADVADALHMILAQMAGEGFRTADGWRVYLHYLDTAQKSQVNGN